MEGIMLNKIISNTLPYFPKKFIWQFSKNYIAGETTRDAIEVSKALNRKKFVSSTPSGIWRQMESIRKKFFRWASTIWGKGSIVRKSVCLSSRWPHESTILVSIMLSLSLMDSGKNTPSLSSKIQISGFALKCKWVGAGCYLTWSKNDDSDELNDSGSS